LRHSRQLRVYNQRSPGLRRSRRLRVYNRRSPGLRRSRRLRVYNQRSPGLRHSRRMRVYNWRSPALRRSRRVSFRRSGGLRPPKGAHRRKIRKACLRLSRGTNTKGEVIRRSFPSQRLRQGNSLPEHA